MRGTFSRREWLILSASAVAAGASAAPARFNDPLDTTAERVARPQASALLAVARAGNRLVGVGLRGVIVVSDDMGLSWTQANSPVQSDLTGVHFPNADQGCAVGHDGVILRTVDGGRNWKKKLDGRLSSELFKADYEKRFAAGQVSRADLDQVSLNYQNGPSLPYLDVWFEDKMRGWAVGSFGMLVSTEDGGESWVPALHRADNPSYLNLFSIRGVGGEVFVTAERGQVFKLNRETGRFVGGTTGYSGSLFGITGHGRSVLAFGLRGTLFHSADAGQTWNRVPIPLTANFTAGTFLNERLVILGNIAGALLGSADGGRSFKALPGVSLPGLTGLHPLDEGRVLAHGLRGTKVLTQSVTQF